MERGVIQSSSVDRLSSLCDDVLIGIMSFLPLRSAIATESLSRRWRRLWTNVTSIIIKRPSDFVRFPELMSHIISPSIDRFIVDGCEVEVGDSSWRRLLDSWLRQVGDRNVRELKLSAYYWSSGSPKNILPSFILEMQSLTSIELCWIYNLQLPDDDQINLPNLKRLWLTDCRVDCKLLGTLIKACPSLEDLSLIFWCMEISAFEIRVFNQNLRRLVIDTGGGHIGQVVINAPKLELLVSGSEKCVIFCFEDKPLALREAKLEMYNDSKLQRWDEDKGILELYEAISNVSFLTLEYVPDKMSTVFSKATRVTLIMKKHHNIKTVPSLIEACPLLDVLTLKMYSGINDMRGMILGKHNGIKTSRRVLKKLEIIHKYWKHNGIKTSRRVLKKLEIIHKYWDTYREPSESFLNLVQYLLSGAIDLEHFYYKAAYDPYFRRKKAQKRMELDLCKVICKYGMASSGCKVEFEGMFHKYVSI